MQGEVALALYNTRMRSMLPFLATPNTSFGIDGIPRALYRCSR